MSFDLELTDRRALVTAGTKGIGAAVVEVLHNAGAAVVATARAIAADAPTGVLLGVGWFVLNAAYPAAGSLPRGETRQVRSLLEQPPLRNEVIRVGRGRIVTSSEFQRLCMRQPSKQGFIHRAVK